MIAVGDFELAGPEDGHGMAAGVVEAGIATDSPTDGFDPRLAAGLLAK